MRSTTGYSRRWQFGLGGFILLGLLTSQTMAQPRDTDKDRRKKVIGGILKQLIESQVPPTSQPPRSGNPNKVRPQPIPPLPAPPRGVNPMQVVTKELSAILEDSRDLANDLATRSRTNYGYRRLLGSCTQVNALAAGILRASNQTRDYRDLYWDIKQLDQELVGLTYQITSIPAVPRSLSELAGHLNEHNENITRLYGLKNNLDYQALSKQASALSIHLKSLLDDLQLLVRQYPRNAYLVNDGIEVNRLAYRFSHSISHQDSYDSLVKEYKTLAASLNKYYGKLQGLNDVFIQRGMARVVAVDGEIHNLLQITRGLDRQRLAALATTITKDLSRFCDGITLSMIMRIPGGDEIPAAADQLDGVCANFLDVLNRKSSDEDLVDAFEYIPSAWVGFSQNFQSLQSPQIQGALQDLESHVKELRDTLRIPAGMDPKAAAQLAMHVEENAEQLSLLVNAWFRRPEARELEATFRNELNRDLASIEHNAHSLEVQLLSNGNPAQFKTLVQTLAASWKHTQEMLSRCDTPEQQQIRELQRHITRDMVQLQTLFLF